MKIKYGIFSLMLIFMLLLSGVYSYQAYQNQYELLLNGINKKLYTAAMMARATLPLNYHDNITDANSVTKTKFNEIVSRYNDLCLRLGMEYLWSLEKINGKIVFTSSTSPDKITANQKHAVFFEVHSNPELFEKTLLNQKPQYKEIRSKWGNTQVVLIPFQDSHGRPYLFGASMKLSEVKELRHQNIKQALSLGLFFLLTGIILSYILSKLISLPLNDLASETSIIASGDLDKEARERGFHEQILLAKSFNKMRLAIKEKIKALAESEEKLSTLFHAMTEMVVLHELTFDENGEAINYRITDCNRAFTSITGIKKENAVGRLSTEVYESEEAPDLKEFSHVALSGQPFEYTQYYPKMDKHFAISVVSPRKNHFATITTDITTIKQIQELVASKNKELENYLYIASHDLRSPLVNIQGFSQRLQNQTNSIKDILKNYPFEEGVRQNLDEITDSSIPRALNFIFTNVSKMDVLIKGLLQISRTGRIKMSIKKVDMNKLMEQVIHSLSFEIEAASAKVILNNLPESYGDETLLNQLFSNIIGNALKYRDRTRRLIITISAKTDYNRIIYSIEDTGIGIPEKNLEKIWNVFYQIDPNSLEAGDGIGLSIAKRITDKHRGEVSVESRINVGTVFYIKLNRNEFTETE